MLPADTVILQVSPSDTGGGAERVAADLHTRYLARGFDAWLALGADHHRLPNTVEIPNTRFRSPWARAVLTAAGLADPAVASPLPRPLQRAARLLAEPSRYARVLAGHEDFDAPGTGHLLELTPKTPDVLHLHNLHGSYFDVRALPALASRVPTILTLHDAWLLTGHCAHPMGCTGWLDGCGECPALDRYVPIRRDASPDNLAVKRRAILGSGVRIATPSSWLAGLVERSGLAEGIEELRVVPNGVDTSVFSPGDRGEARASLGLPADAFVVAFAARGARDNPFKGFETLERALPLIADSLGGRDVMLVAIGEESPKAGESGPAIRFVPFVEDPHVLARYYRAADAYLHPAVAETFGLAPLEAMACGTPVVATDVGGIPEVVEADTSGLLVPPGDERALAAATTRLATDDGLRALIAEGGLERARLFPLERQADAYLGWYAEILGRGNGRPATGGRA